MKKKRDTKGYRVFRFICLALVMPLTFIGVNLLVINKVVNEHKGTEDSIADTSKEVVDSFSKVKEYASYIDLKNKSVKLPSKLVSDKQKAEHTTDDTQLKRLEHISRAVYLLNSIEAPEDGNKVVSEISLLKALEMLSEGADNDTKAQLDNWIGKESETDLTPDIQSNTVKTANLFLARSDENFPVSMREDYKALLESKFNSKGRTFSTHEAKAVAEEENIWISELTEGMITNGVTESLLTDTSFVASLYNIIYFNGSWGQPLTVSTEHMKFKQRSGNELNARYVTIHDGKYFTNDTAEFFTKHYIDREDELPKRYEFIGILPKQENWELSKVDIATMNKYTEPYNLTVKIPTFDYEIVSDLKKPLQQSGVQFIFDAEKVDLSNGFESSNGASPCVGSISQKSHIQFNENGTKAASVTEIDIVATSAMTPVRQEPKEIKLDFNRPFIYMIYDTQLDIPIFTGIVNTPDILN